MFVCFVVLIVYCVVVGVDCLVNFVLLVFLEILNVMLIIFYFRLVYIEVEFVVECVEVVNVIGFRWFIVECYSFVGE